jgi:hypothetical protein
MLSTELDPHEWLLSSGELSVVWVWGIALVKLEVLSSQLSYMNP